MRVIGADEVRRHLDHQLAIDAVESAFVEHVAGRTAVSEPPLLRLPFDGNARFQAKAAKVGRVIGLRVAGERDDRHVDEGRRMLLYDADDLVPTALVDERELYRIRVGAQIAVTVSHLRPADSAVLTVIGAGRLARATIEAIQSATPFRSVRIHSRAPDSRARLVQDLTGRVPGALEVVDELPAALAVSDVVVTITTATSPVVAGADLRPGTLVVSAGGGFECDAEVYRRCDRLIVDDWDHCVQVGDIGPLHAQGVVAPGDVAASLPEVVAGGATPPCGPTEILVAVPQGMTIVDVALAAQLLGRLDAAGGA